MAVCDLGDDPLQPNLAGMRVHLFAIKCEALAELDVGLADDLLELCLALDQRQFPQVVTIEIKQVEGDQHNPARTAFQLILQNREIRGAVNRWNDDLAVDDRRPGTNVPCVGSDFLETMSPVVAASGEDPDLGIAEMDLDAVAVEFDFVNPPVAPRNLVDRAGQRRFDESGVRGLEADRRGFPALRRHYATPPPKTGATAPTAGSGLPPELPRQGPGAGVPGL